MEGEIRLTLAVPADLAAREAPPRQAGLEELLSAHQRRIFRIALRLLGDVDDAWSTTQDCFLRAYQAWDRCPIEEVGRQRWLSRIVVNLALDQLRSRKWKWWRDRLGLPEYETSDADTSPRTPEREALNVELGGRLMQALNLLPARQRAVFVLRHYEDYSLDRIAEELGLSVGTVKSHLSRALEKLREELKEFYGRASASE